MKCPHCNSEWKTDESISASLTSCPFCKESLAEREEPKFYDNSKEALAFIMKQFGAEVLLGGNLKAYFSDIAPSVSNNIKRLVYGVYENGAAQILKRNLTASQADKEIAVRVAIKQLTESFIVPDMAETVIYEFAAALGWQVVRTIPVPQVPESQSVVMPKPAVLQPQSQPVKPLTPLTPNNIKISLKIGSIIPFGNYKWRVLGVQGGKTLIITEDVIEIREYNTEREGVTWETCTLREYLNGEFLQEFTRGQQCRIIETTIRNPKNLWYGTNGGRDTDDRIFLLSIKEVVKYFGDNRQLWNKNPKGEYMINDQYNSTRIARDIKGKMCWWWLRSSGDDVHSAAVVDNDGTIHICGYGVHSRNGGVRPALCLKL